MRAACPAKLVINFYRFKNICSLRVQFKSWNILLGTKPCNWWWLWWHWWWISGKKFELWSTSLCNFLPPPPPATSSHPQRFFVGHLTVSYHAITLHGTQNIEHITTWNL